MALKSQNSLQIEIKAEPEPIKIDLSKTALIVVDMQNSFASPGGYFALKGIDISLTRKTIKPCQRVINLARNKKIKVIYLQTGHPAELLDNPDIKVTDFPFWFKSAGLSYIKEYPELRDKFHIHGTWGAEIIDELKPAHGDIIVKKEKHNGFLGTNLEDVLKTYGIRYLLFTGVATNICVESTLRHAFWLGYFCILIADAVSPLGSSLTQKATLFNVESAFGWVTTSANIGKAISSIKLPENS